MPPSNTETQPDQRWREIVLGVTDEDESGEPLDPPVNYTLGQLVDDMRSLGSIPERAAWFRARDPERKWEGIEWDGVIESIVHALETDRYDGGPTDG